jgi:hypothetical protein
MVHRIRAVSFVVVAASLLWLGSAFAQGNSGCSGTIQGGAGQSACNAYGLCKAYFAGSPTGQSHKRQAGPFVALAEAACSGTQDCGSSECACFDGSCGTTTDCVATFCPDTNPAGNGRNPSDGSPGQSKK